MIKHNRTLTTTLIFTCFALSLQAQNIRGFISDTSHHPLGWANVTLLDANKKFIAGSVSKEDGSFNVVLDKNNTNCILVASYVGMQSDTLLVSSQNIATPLDIVLNNDNVLNEVNVVAARKLFKDNGDVITADIENTILSQSGTFDKMMNQIPFVSGSDGSYNVFGRGEAQIYINGHKMYNADELKLLSADKIKKVEIITNPSAKYSSDVKAVIKVYTKDNPEGIGGNVMTFLQQGRKFSDFGNASIIYNHQKLQIVGSASFNETRRKEYARDKTEIIKDILYESGDNVTIDYDGTNENINLGMNYNYSGNHNIGLNMLLNTNNMKNKIILSDLYHMSNGVKDFDTQAKDMMGYKPLSWTANTYWNFNIGKTKTELTNDFLLGRRKNTYGYTETTDATVNTFGIMRYLMNSTIIDFNTTIVRNLNFNYGAELTYSRERQNFNYTEENISTGMAKTGDERRQLLNAEYLNLGYHLKEWSLNAGLRYEYTDIGYYKDHVKQESQSRKYHDFMPTVNISFKPVPFMNLSLGYRKTVIRPNYGLLNDNLRYNSRYQYVQGNSQLKPEYTNSLNFLASYRNLRLIGSLDFMKNAIISARSIYGSSNDIVLSKSENMPDYRKFSIGANWWEKFGIYTPYLECNFSRQDFSYEYNGAMKEFNQPFVSFKIHHTLSLPRNTTLMLFVDFNGDNYTLFRVHTYRWSSQLSISRQLDSGWYIQLSGNNLLCSGKFKSITYCDWIKDATSNDSDYRNLSLTISYNFNHKQKKHNSYVKSSEARRF